MANYIVDASVVIEYLIQEAQTPKVQRFFNQLTDTDLLIAPEFCLLECTNVLWKQMRFNGMSLEDADALLGVLRSLKLRRTPMKRLLDRALRIAITQRLAVYDSGYIALALHYGYPLLTLDQLQARAAIDEGVMLHPL